MALHLSGPEVEAAIADAVDSPATATVRGTVKQAAAVTAPVTTGVITPANVAYTQADQTALANAVLSLASKYNALVASLVASGALHV